ncbi:MAG TPA: lysophospholipid acyltransferase family protein [Bacteroidia bacterium]|nr:lysophospholipid acyltransferase family protein [Bacteroidia bacterium]HNT80886.1 lysophospholipid acyltransferase family protein [Bacteroidia bacterium]
MNSILRYIFSIYAILIFIVSLFVFYTIYTILFLITPEKKAANRSHKVGRAWAKVLFLVFFIRVKYHNLTKIKKDQIYVFVANHKSLLDVPVLAYATKNTFKYLAKEELTKIPIMGYLIKRLYFTVNRQDRADRKKSMERMMSCLNSGVSLGIYPEGTRNKSEEYLLPFKEGAFRLAVAAQKPIGVLTIVNSDRLLSSHKLMQLSPGTLHAYWSDPIETLGKTEKDIPELIEECRKKMISFLQLHEKK